LLVAFDIVAGCGSRLSRTDGRLSSALFPSLPSRLRYKIAFHGQKAQRMSETLLNWDAYLSVASLSDIGMRRSNNQDNLSVSLASSIEQWQRRGHLFVVADGMGAHAAGELASKLAVDHIPHLYAKFDDVPAAEALKKAVNYANTEIHRRGQANEDFHNMGTTCSVLALLPSGAVVAHVGDSRVYRLRRNRLEQLTFDHSLVWEMKYSGQLTDAEEASGRIPKNVITRSLGPYAESKVDLEGPFPIQVNDIYLLCSDGLSGLVSDQEIGSLLANLPPNEASQVLVDLANLRGGPDNITCIIVQVKHPSLATAGSEKSPSMSSAMAVKTSKQWLPAALPAVAAVAAILLYFFGFRQWAWISGAIGLVFLVWFLIRLIGAYQGNSRGQTPPRFGRGPYTQLVCASGKDVTNQLREITLQLKKGAEDENWDIDLTALNALLQKAELASKNGASPDVVRAYARCISFMMDQLRNQQG